MPRNRLFQAPDREPHAVIAERPRTRATAPLAAESNQALRSVQRPCDVLLQKENETVRGVALKPNCLSRMPERRVLDLFWVLKTSLPSQDLRDLILQDIGVQSLTAHAKKWIGRTPHVHRKDTPPPKSQ